MKTRSYASFQANAGLMACEIELPQLQENEILVEVEVCGLCHSDIHLMDDAWKITTYPFVPGHEIVGKVSQKGSKVQELQIGQRVGIGWQRSCCNECNECNKGLDNCCQHKEATCVGYNGGFASFVVIACDFAFPIPDALSSEEAAPLLCAGITVFSPLARHCQQGMNVGIVGVGGLGHLAIQFAHHMGCNVTVFSTSQDKENEALQLGAKRFVLSSSREEMKKYDTSLDFILSTIHAPLNLSYWSKLLKPNGQFCFVGAPNEPLSIHAGSLIMNQLSIMGSNIGSKSEMKKMLEMATEKKIAPIIERFELKEVNQAIEKVRNNQVRYRAVIQVKEADWVG